MQHNNSIRPTDHKRYLKPLIELAERHLAKGDVHRWVRDAEARGVEDPIVVGMSSNVLSQRTAADLAREVGIAERIASDSSREPFYRIEVVRRADARLILEGMSVASEVLARLSVAGSPTSDPRMVLINERAAVVVNMDWTSPLQVTPPA